MIDVRGRPRHFGKTMAAIAQIRERGYAHLFRGISTEDNVVLCGVTYDPRTKTHRCLIER